MIDQSAFRDALGTFVTGVTIVTAYDSAGKPSGLTANSFNSVSLDPPMVLWSLSLGSRNLPVFREAKAWAVHILAADQQPLSNRFAQAGADKFGDLDHDEGPEGAPRIAGCTARFGCTAKFEYEGGDHAIFLGEVIDFERTPAEPLIYHGGRYGRVMPEGEAPSDAQTAQLLADGLIVQAGEQWELTPAGQAQLRLLRQLVCNSGVWVMAAIPSLADRLHSAF